MPRKPLNRMAWLEPKDNRERSKAGEKKFARTSGGQVQRASGATQGRKGDVFGINSIESEGEGLLFEHKTTKGIGYRLTLQELEKIEREAFDKGKRGAMVIAFEDKHEYIVIRREFVNFGGE